MLTCKQVSKALEKGDYNNLSPWSKATLKFHVALCTVCGRYNKQIMVIQDGVRNFLQHEEAGDDGGPSLPPEKKQTLQEAVQHAAHPDA